METTEVQNVDASLLRTKVDVPRTSGEHRERHRLTELFRGHLARSKIVLVTATAGSGKTTAVVDAMGDIGMTPAWLTLDAADASAGRLLTYLEASLRRVDPTISAAASKALADGIAHVDAAALLAEAIGSREIIIVLDDLERIAEAGAAVASISAFLRYLPERAHAIAVSRRDVALNLSREEVAGAVARVSEGDLALTVTEAQALLADRDRTDVDPQEAVESTAGWLAGVLFDSWRSTRHVHGTGGEADALHTYLSSEIMSSLPDAAQHFLIVTSVLDDVTASRAEALGIADPASILALLRKRHLPVNFREPQRMRCHPRLREYLLERLNLLEPGVVRGIHAAHADLLVDEGRKEEAVHEYLRAGDVAQAEDTAADVVLAVIRRLDFELAEYWLRSFRRWRIDSSVALTEAELLIALERERYGIGTVCADRLLRLLDTSTRRTSDSSPHAAMAWCYFLTGRIDDARSVLAVASPGPQTTVMAFAIGEELLDNPMHYQDRPLNTGTEFDGMLARIDLAHGRFERVLESTSTQYDAVLSAQIGALTGLGRLEEALERLAENDGIQGWTHIRMKAELLAELGRPEDAWTELIKGREVLSLADSTLYRMFALLTEAMLALRFSRDTALASAILDAAEREPTSQQRVRVVEQVALWRGLAGLIDGDEVAATTHLRKAVAYMEEWDRLLLLPTAAVYLAEAEWRHGEDDAADAAADLALAAADRTGSRHGLIRALREFPAVLSRRLDKETDPDSAWHDLGRAVMTMSPGLRSAPKVHVSEFGDPTLLVDHRRHRLKLAKSAELLAFLAAQGGRATKADIILGIFDSKNDKAAHAYLRMATNRVRDIFPEGDVLKTDGETISWNRGTLASDYTRLRTKLVRLRNVQGQQRLSMALDALADIPTGEYLPGSRSQWATEQRQRWTDLTLDINHAAAEAAFDAADYATASVLIDDVVERDPFRERAWRLRMRISSSVGDGDGVIAAYRRCESALSSMSIAPSESTRQLLNRLRF